MRGRRVFLENPKHVDVVLEERQLREIAMVAKNRSEFIRDAIDLALGHKDFAAVHKLREENEKLRRENEKLRRENEELKRQLEEAAELIEILKGERKAQGLDAKRYQTSFGWLTAEEIKAKFMEKKPAKPLEWLSAVLYNDAVAIQEVASLLGLQDTSSSSSSAVADAKDAAVRRRKRLMEEWDFKRLAEEWNCSEEEARRMVAEKMAQSSSSSESASSEEASSSASEAEAGEGEAEEEARSLIKRARSILEGY